MRSIASTTRPLGSSFCRSVTRSVSRSLSVRVSAIAIGDKLPAFTLQSDDKKMISSADMVKDKGVVIFIYPRANTSGCTCQANGFKDNLSTFNTKGYDVYGLSADTPEAQAAWKAQEGLTYPLLCDPEFTVLPALCGSEKRGKITRTHIVVEKGGVVSDVKLAIGSKESVPEALKWLRF
ncbi:hypothetical protein FOA52_004051 [Chlamydomonas sp. UWO 241]|nr:hypothetical protein FOA52_004051 [Chlamydomonas sp. UWO 241]